VPPAKPTAAVDTAFGTSRIVSWTASPALVEPPGELR
jgi:hypothetical protein